MKLEIISEMSVWHIYSSIEETKSQKGALSMGHLRLSVFTDLNKRLFIIHEVSYVTSRADLRSWGNVTIIHILRVISTWLKRAI